MPFTTETKLGYRASRDGKKLIIHDVEIFCTCEREGISFDTEWISRAVRQRKLAEMDSVREAPSR